MPTVDKLPSYYLKMKLQMCGVAQAMQGYNFSSRISLWIEDDLIYAGIHQHQTKRLKQHSNKLVNY